MRTERFEKIALLALILPASLTFVVEVGISVWNFVQYGLLPNRGIILMMLFPLLITIVVLVCYRFIFKKDKYHAPTSDPNTWIVHVAESEDSSESEDSKGAQ